VTALKDGEIAEALQVATDEYNLLVERLNVLEDSLVDQGWQRLGDSAGDFSRHGLKLISLMAKIYWLKNPLIKRAVTVQTLYVWGQGCVMRATNPKVDKVVQKVLSDPANKAVWGDIEARMRLENSLQLFGNIFFAFFVNSNTGHIKVRIIPFDEVAAIISNPEDSADPWYYYREWTATVTDFTTGVSATEFRKAYYPDWRHQLRGKHPSSIGNIPIVDIPIYHVSVNRLPDMQFGVSEVYAACDWANAYKVFLEKWVTITDALSKFAMRLTGSQKVAVNSAISKLASAFQNKYPNSNTEMTGGVFASTDSMKLEPIKTSGITTGMNDARRLMLMVCSATGINEPYLTGDPSTGNLATARSMERPMELQFRSRQTLWAGIFSNILDYIIDNAAAAPNGPLRTGVDIVVDDDGDRFITLAKDDDGEPINRAVEIIFPPILEHSTVEQVGAIVDAATLKGASKDTVIPIKYLVKVLLDALDRDGSQELVDEWFGDDEEKTPVDTEEALARAIGKLSEYIHEVSLIEAE